MQAFAPRAQDNGSGSRRPGDGSVLPLAKAGCPPATWKTLETIFSYMFGGKKIKTPELWASSSIGSALLHFSSILAKSTKRQLGLLLTVSAIKINQQHLSVFGS